MSNKEYLKIVEKGVRLFDNVKRFNMFMNTPNFVLGRKPIDSSFKEVDEMLNKID